MNSKIVKLLLSIVLIICGCSNHITHQSNKEQTDLIQTKSQFAIESWIRNHALFPDSYKPLKYESVRHTYTFQNSIEVIPLRKYQIEHTFELQDTSNKLLVSTMDFELQPDFFIDCIRYKEKGVIYLQTRHYPPVYDDWLLQFGRSLSSADTLEWQVKNRQSLYNLSVQFNENRYNKSSKENLKLADSLVLEINNSYVN